MLVGSAVGSLDIIIVKYYGLRSFASPAKEAPYKYSRILGKFCAHCSVQVCVLGPPDGRVDLGGGRDGVHGGPAGERAGATGRAHLVPRHPRCHAGGRRQI